MTNDSQPSGDQPSHISQLSLSPEADPPIVVDEPISPKPEWLYRVIVHPHSDERVLETFWVSPSGHLFRCRGDHDQPPTAREQRRHAPVAVLLKDRIRYLVSMDDVYSLDVLITDFKVVHYFHTTDRALALETAGVPKQLCSSPSPTLVPPPPAPSL